MGGAVAAIEAGYMQDEIEQAAYEYAKAVDDGEKIIVGVNKYVDAELDGARGVPDRPRAAARSRPSGCKTLTGQPRPGGGRRRAGRRRGRGPRHAEPAACR